MQSLNNRQKYAFRIMAAGLSLLSLVQFLLYYVPIGFFYEKTLLLLISAGLADFLEGAFPIIAATVIFLTRDSGKRNKIAPSILISLTRLFYTVPYYYIYYVSGVYNSVEAIVIAAAVSLLFLVFFFLETFVCIYLINLAERRANKTADDRKRTSLFNLDDHLNFGILLSVVLIFTVNFVKEIISTTSYLISNKGTYRIDEIITIVVSFLILFVFAFLYYLISAFIKNRLFTE